MSIGLRYLKKKISCNEIKKTPKEQLKGYEKLEHKIYPLQTILMIILLITSEYITVTYFIRSFDPNYLLIIDIEMLGQILLGISLAVIIVLGFNYFYLINYKIKNEKLNSYLKSK